MTTILIVDDQPDNLYVLERLLKGQGYTVVQATTGEDALELARSGRPDLMLLDVMMPGMDGFEVVRRLRDNFLTRALPVVLLTANAPDQRLKIQGLNLGADEYLTQPINNSELLARVRSLLRSKHAQDELHMVNMRLQALLDVVQASSSTLDLAEVGEQVIRGALRASAMDAGGIWLRDGADLVSLTQIGYSDALSTARQRITSEMGRFMFEVMQNCKPIYGASATFYGPDDPYAKEIVSLIMLPLMQRDEALGVLQLGVRTSRTFNQDDIQFLQTIGSAAASAVQNARLFAQSVHSREQLEAANQEKDEFISIVSHELKNPLASIKGYASLLQRRARKDANLQPAVKGLEVIDQQVARMSLLLDQLRDVSNIGINRFSMEAQVVDLAALVERVAGELQATTLDHELMLTVRDGPMLANVDEFRIGQVLSNLIGNAIKYSAAGTRVEIRIERTTPESTPVTLEPGLWTCIDVTDQGIGISPSVQERLFERFFRAENAKSQANGMGLGLFIAREIVQLHGGHMWVRSEEDKGSTFSVALPLVKE